MAPIKISFLALAAVAACAGTSTAIVPAITIASTIIQPSAQSNTSSALLAITTTSSTIQKSTSVSGSKGAAAATNVAQFGAFLGLGVPVMLGIL